jgi:hypothetical protein
MVQCITQQKFFEIWATVHHGTRTYTVIPVSHRNIVFIISLNCEIR